MKRLVGFILALALLITAVPLQKKALAAGGSKDFLQDVEQQQEVPEGYTGIYTQDDLRAVEADPAGKYILMNDIQLSGDWAPLCNSGQRFSGVLEGNGYTIRGLDITTEVHQGGDYAIGLFARMYDATVSSLMVEGQVTINKGPKDGLDKGTCFVGGLVGEVDGAGSDISNCVSNVTITVNEPMTGVFEYEGYAGLIGAFLSNGRVDYCRNLGDIKGNSRYVAGLVYHLGGSGSMVNCFGCVNEGSVEGAYCLAGVIGQIRGTVSMQCFVNKGTVTGDDSIAGIVYDAGMFAKISDCLNMGEIRLTRTGSVGAGIAQYNESSTIRRCVNVGNKDDQEFGSIVTINGGKLEDCHYWSGTLYEYETDAGRYAMPSTDTTGLLTAEQMAQQESFENYNFENIWTMDTKLGHPYPTALMTEEMENAYKIRYVENMLALAETAKYSELMTGSGEGSMAGMLAEAYQKAGVIAQSNELWSGLTKVKDLLQWNVEIENEYDLIIAELLAGAMAEDIFAEQVNNEVLAAISDFATYYTESMEPLAEAEIHDALKSMADSKDLYSPQFKEIFQKLNTLLTSHADALKTAEDFIGKIGGVVSIADVIAAGCVDTAEYLNYYALCTGYVEATASYAEILRESADACETLGQWPDTTEDLQKAVRTLEETLNEASAGSKEVLYRACAEEAGEAVLGVGGNILDIIGVFSNLHPVLAGGKAGIMLGVLLSNQFTSMDDVAFYGKMMYMIGVLSQGMHQVVIDREVAFENHSEYEEAEALSEAIDMYLNLQIIACDYAIGYFNALCSAEITKLLDLNDSDGKAPWFLREEQEMILLLKGEKDRLVQLKESGQSVYVGLDGTIGGFIVACPVTVIVETKDGEEIARLETGKMTVADGIDGNYAIMGADGEQKTGFFDPEEHNLKIIGEADGTMNVVIYYGADGELTESYELPNVTVEKGKTYVWSGTDLAQDGEGSFF